MDHIIELLSRELDRPVQHVENIVTLLDEGNTVPFIARYRKELHGAMDDQLIRQLADRLQYLRNLQDRRDEVKQSIENQGKLTDELSAAIDAASTLAEVEDLYRPYKQKRRTRATMAREKGLEPLAELAFAIGPAVDLEGAAADYIDPGKGVETVQDALQGASDIVAEWISDDADVRKLLRELYWRRASIVSRAAAKEPEDSVYRLYYEFSSPVSKTQGHQILAMNRGEREEILKVDVEMDRETALDHARELGLEVIYTGMVPHSDVLDYYRLGDLFVTASTSETQGLTYFEALAAGVPVLCRRDPCVDGVVEDGINGWQYDSGEDFGRCLSSFCGDKVLRERMRAAARESSEKFSAEAFGAAAERLYASVQEAAMPAAAGER